MSNQENKVPGSIEVGESNGSDKLIVGNKMRTGISTKGPQLKQGNQFITEDISAKMSRDQIAARLPDTEFYHTSNGIIPVQASPDVQEELVKSLVSLWIDALGKDKLIESYTLNNPKLVEGLSDKVIEASVMDGLNKLAGNYIDLGHAFRRRNSWWFPHERFYPESAYKIINLLSEFLNKW